MATGQRNTQTALEVLRLDAEAANRRRREFYTTAHADNLQRASDDAQAALARLIEAARAVELEVSSDARPYSADSYLPPHLRDALAGALACVRGAQA